MTPDELHAHLLSLADPACKAFGDRLQPASRTVWAFGCRS